MRVFLQPLTILTVLISLSIMVWTFRSILLNVRARLYFLLMISISIYALGYSQELIQTTFTGLLFWIKFEYLGVAFIPAFLLLLALHCRFYYENENLHRGFYIILLPGLVILISNWVYPTLRIFYEDFSVIFKADGLILDITPGPIYFLHIAQTILSIGASIILYALCVFKYGDKRRSPYIWMIVGTAIPGITFILYILSVFPDGIDPIPIAMALVGPFLAVGIFSRRLMSDLTNAKSKYYENSQHPVFIFNKNGRLIDLNKSASMVFHFTRKHVLNKHWPELVGSVEDGEIINTEAKKSKGNELTYKDRVFKLNTFNYEDSLGHDRGTLRILYDITEVKRAMRILTHKATTDGLTGLLNRNHWESLVEKSIKQAIRFSHPGSLFLIDLDKFKLVNDTYGHQAGDAVLKEISARLKSTLRSIDILGRYGGEELCVWLTETPPESAVVVAEKCRTIISEAPMIFENLNIPITASFGVCGEDTIDGKELSYYLKGADKALYKAKADGRNRVIVAAP